MGGEGWIEAVSLPFYANGKYKGFANASLYPLEISKKLFIKNKHHVIFLGADSSLSGISDNAKTLLNVKELTDFNYLEQLKKNAFVQDEFKLTHKSQKPYMQQIGKNVLAGKKKFDITIEGKEYTVIAADIPEIKFYVVGLVEK